MISKVYLIDDDDICLLTSEFILSESYYADQCLVFKDSQIALLKLKKDMEKGSLPEIIILDLKMPEMSGLDFLNALQPYEENLRNKCFIYVLTSSVDETELVRAKNCSLVYELIEKPFSPQKLDEIVREIVFMRNKYS